METNIETKKPFISSVAENMQQRESLIRLILSALLVSAIFIDPAIQHKILFADSSLYMFTTAIMKWDPIYALLREYRANGDSSEAAIRTESFQMFDIESGDGISAANDSAESENELKNTG